MLGSGHVAALWFLANVLVAQQNTRDWCAVRILVLEGDGEPIPGAKIRMRPGFAEAEETVLTANDHGSIDVCDFDNRSRAFSVGSEWCNTTELRNVEAVPHYEQRLKMYVNRCYVPHMMLGGCIAYLRVSGTDGKPVEGADISMPAKFGVFKRQTDMYGRVTVAVGSGKAVELDVSAVGYESGKLSLRCESVGYLKERVVLKRKQAPR